MSFRAVIRNSLTGLEKTFEDAQVCADFLAGEVKEIWEGVERLVLPEPTPAPVVAEEVPAELAEEPATQPAVVAEPAAEPVAQDVAVPTGQTGSAEVV